MAAPNVATHIPIIPLLTVSGNTPNTVSIPEAASQTFKQGVPVQVNGSGYNKVWDGTTVSAGIIGVSNQFGSNLATAGVGAPGVFGQIGPPGAIQTYGSVPNQSSAVNIALGTPITDGRTLVLSAVGDTIFEAMCDASSGSTFTPTEASLYAFYGLTADTNGYWYIDLAKTTVGTNTVVQVVGFNPIDQLSVNARLRFIFAIAARQVNQ